MRKIIDKVAVILTVMLVILGNYGLPIFSLVVQAEEELPVEYTIQVIDSNAKTARITGVNNIPSNHELQLPDQINQNGQLYTITEIGNNVFKGKGLTSVQFGQSLTKIGNYAFADNALTAVELPNSVQSIGDEAFARNQIATLNLGQVQTLGIGAFYDNKLRQLVLPDTVTSMNGGYGSSLGVFEKNQLVSIQLSQNLTSIPNRAFANNALTSLSLPDKITTIGNSAFRDNDLQELDTNQVQSISSLAFANNNLRDLKIPNVVTISSDYTFGGKNFAYNQLTDVSIGNNLQQLPDDTFIYNNRFVAIQTTNPNIHSSIHTDGSYGHVVNPVSIIVQSLKEDGSKLIDDQIINSNFYDKDSIFSLGQSSTYVPKAMLGYQPVEPSITFTPDKDKYVIQVHYKQAEAPSITPKDALVISKDETYSVEKILSFFDIKDYVGNDLTSKATVTPLEEITGIGKELNTKIPVTISVTDSEGRVTSKTFDFIVTKGLIDFPIGKIWISGPDTPENMWMLGDFKYNGNTVTGFTRTGIDKFHKQSVELTKLLGLENAGSHSPDFYSSTTLSNGMQVILPHINPYTKENITLGEIDLYHLAYVWYIVKVTDYLSEVTENKGNIEQLFLGSESSTNIQVFDDSVFKSLKAAVIDIDVSPNIKEIKKNSIERLETFHHVFHHRHPNVDELKVSFPNLKSVSTEDGSRGSFYPKEYYDTLNDFKNLEYFGLTSLNQTKDHFEVYAPNLKKITDRAFKYSKNLSRPDGKVVIYSDFAENIPISDVTNYLVVKPGEHIEDLENITYSNYEFTRADFAYADVDEHIAIGLNTRGYLKLQALINSNLSEKILTFPDNIMELRGGYTITFPNIMSYSEKKYINYNWNLPSIDTIVGGNIKKISNVTFYASDLKYLEFKNVLEIKELDFLNYYSENNYYFDFANMPNLERVDFSSLKTVNTLKIRSKHAVHFPMLTSMSGLAIDAPELHFPNVEKLDANDLTSTKAPDIFFEKLIPGEYIVKESYWGSSSYAPFNGTRYLHINNPLWTNEDLNALTILKDGAIKQYANMPTVKIQYQTIDNGEIHFSESQLLDQSRKIFEPKSQSLIGISDRYELSGAQLIRIENGEEKIVSQLNKVDLTENAKKIIGPDISAEYFRSEWIVRYTYAEQSDEPVVGVNLIQKNDKDLRTGDIKNTYRIGDKMYSSIGLDLTGFNGNIPAGSKIKIQFNPKYIQNIQLGTGINSSISDSNIDLERGIIQLTTKQLFTGTQLEIPIEWEFKKMVTPQNYQLNIDGSLIFEYNNSLKRVVANVVSLIGTYSLPTMRKGYLNGNKEYYEPKDSQQTKGTARFGSQEAVFNIDGERIYRVGETVPVTFTFKVDNLQRQIAKGKIEDTLPVYPAVDDQGVITNQIAVFDASLNPGWQLSEDGKKVITEFNYAEGIPKLKLTFPHLQLRQNVTNTANMTLYPTDPGENEVIEGLTSSATLYQPAEGKEKPKGNIYFGKKELGIPRKDGNTTFFYDTEADRQKVIPFILEAKSTKENTNLQKVVLTDYQLDSRLYYESVEVPTTLTEPATVTLIAYGSSTNQEGTNEREALLDPSHDTVLQRETLQLKQGTKITFNPLIAGKIRYLQFVFPESYALGTKLIQFKVNTKLKEPDKVQYSATNGAVNRFANDGLLSGEATDKNTGKPTSSRLNFYSYVGQKYQSKLDGIEGNYLSHNQAAVYVKPVEPKIAVKKGQVIHQENPQAAVIPGTKIDYALSIDPQNLGEQFNPANLPVDIYMHHFMLVDLIPRGLQVDLNTVRLSSEFSQQLGANWRYQSNYLDGQDALIFTADKVHWGDIKEIAHFTSEVDDTISGTSSSSITGAIRNNAYLSVDDVDGIELTGEGATLSVEPDRTWVKSTVEASYMRPREMFARKYIRLANTPWSAGTIETDVGQSFDYKLVITNGTSTAREHLDIVDVFPYQNDQSIQETTLGSDQYLNRGSEFSNILDTSRNIQILLNGADVTNDYTVTYTTTSGLKANQIAAASWSSSKDASTTAIRIQAREGIQLGENQSLEVIVPMKAPLDESLRGSSAYNTFVYQNATTPRYLESNTVANRIKVQKGTVQFTKYAKKGKAVNADIVPLQGAVFLITSLDGSVVKQAVSNESGVVQFTDLPTNLSYTIREIAAPANYQQSKEVYTVQSAMFDSAIDNNVVISEKPFINIENIKGTLKAEKVYQDGSGKTSLPGIAFQLVGKDINDEQQEIMNQTLYTDSEGKLNVTDLPEGHYTLTELDKSANQSGFVANVTRSFTVDDAHRVIDYTGEQALVNNQYHLLLQKVAVTNEEELTSLANLTDDGRRKLSDFTFTLKEEGSSRTWTQTTDENGQIQLSADLKLNTVYTLTEGDIPASHIEYKHNARAYHFMIKADGQLYEVDENGENENIFRQNIVNFPNFLKTIRGKVTLTKQDYQGIALAGATFGLYQNDQLIATAQSRITPNDPEKAIATFDQLVPGAYIVREIQPPKGYFTKAKDQLVIVPDHYSPTTTEGISWQTVDSQPDNLYYQVTKTIVNYPIKLSVYKGEPLFNSIPMVQAQAEKDRNSQLIIQPIGENGNYANVYLPLTGVEFELYEQEGASWNLIGTYQSNESGKLDFKDFIFNGTKLYKLVETKALPGYISDEQPLLIDFATLGAHSTDGTMQITKVNQRKVGKIIVSKYTKNSSGYVNGMKFGLYDTNGNLLTTQLTGDDGFAVFNNLANGQYIVKEFPRDGYETNREEHFVTINNDTKYISLRYENIPNTKDKTVKVKKVWHATPAWQSKINNTTVNVYLLKPAISQEGKPVYIYASSYYGGILSSQIHRYSNWQTTFSNLSTINDPWGRDYKVTEYSPYKAGNSYDFAEIIQVQGMTGEQPTLTTEHQSEHKLDLSRSYYSSELLTAEDIAESYVTGNATDGFEVHNVVKDETLSTVNIGDRVFIDQNHNGQQDADEKGLAGVNVTLKTEDNHDPTYLAGTSGMVQQPYTTTTNADGYYAFHNVQPGRYKVTFELSQAQKNRGYAFVAQDPSIDAAVDSNIVDTTSGETAPFEVSVNPDRQVNPNGDILDDATIDAGVALPVGEDTASLGDRVFIDHNGNHLQDFGEAGLAGVKVEIVKADNTDPEWFNGTAFVTAPYETTTDAYGYYSFEQLKEGRYRVRFTLTPEQARDYQFIVANVGTDDTIDSDAVKLDDSQALTEAFDLTAGAIRMDIANPLGLTNPTVDAGVEINTQNVVSLGDHVFIDIDGNGSQSSADIGLPGVKVSVVNADGTNPTYLENNTWVTKEYTTTTDAEGNYRFDNLRPGSYKVNFELSVEQRRYYQFISAGEEELSAHAVVNAVNDRQATTAAKAVQLTGMPTFTHNPLNLTRPDFDAGVTTEFVSLGDRVFIDVDGTNTQTPADQGLAGVQVEVRTANGALPTYINAQQQLVQASYVTTTDSEGYYHFDRLLPGHYKVYFRLNEQQKALYRFIAPGQGMDRTKDSKAAVIDDLQPELAVTADAEVLSNANNRQRADNRFAVDAPDFDAGVQYKQTLASVGDLAFIDFDESGTQTIGDGVLPGLTVEIVKEDGSLPTYLKDNVMVTQRYVTTTDDQGRYHFDHLLPGRYRLIFTMTDEQKTRYHYTDAHQGEDYMSDSDGMVDSSNVKIARSQVFTLEADEVARALGDDINPLHLDNPTMDIGVVPLPTMPGAGSMELMLWYLASAGVCCVGVFLMIRRKKVSEKINR